MAEGLIKYETIDAAQIKEIMAGKDPSPPDGWETTKLTDNDHKKNDENTPANGVERPPISGDAV